MKKWLSLLLAALLLLALPALAETEDALDAAFSEAKALFDAGDYTGALPLLEELAEKGSGEAMEMIGRIYFDGLFTESGEPDYAAAKEWYLKAAEAGYGIGMNSLGYGYAMGHFSADGTPDYMTALDWYLKAAELGVPGSIYNVGNNYAKGTVTADGQPDYATAIEWFNKAVELDFLLAAERLADLYIYDNVADDGTMLLARDYAKAFPVLEKADELGTQKPHLLGWLGWFHAGNAPEVMEADYPKAAEYYTRGAELGDGYCMYMLGMLYMEGRVGENDYATAAEWLGKAAETDRLDAAEKLSELYTLGRKAEDGTVLFEVDYAKALPVLEKAYELNTEYTHVHNFLGWLYAGNVPEVMAADYGKALEVYTRGAELNSGYCMEQIGLMYQAGQLGEPDPTEARKWFEAAVAAGHMPAQAHLDQMAE